MELLKNYKLDITQTAAVLLVSAQQAAAPPVQVRLRDQDLRRRHPRLLARPALVPGEHHQRGGGGLHHHRPGQDPQHLGHRGGGQQLLQPHPHSHQHHGGQTVACITGILDVLPEAVYIECDSRG